MIFLQFYFNNIRKTIVIENKFLLILHYIIYIIRILKIIVFNAIFIPIIIKTKILYTIFFSKSIIQNKIIIKMCVY